MLLRDTMLRARTMLRGTVRLVLLVATAGICRTCTSMHAGTMSSTCPGASSNCGCDWTQNGTKCGTTDDGSECFCRCCCGFEKAGFACKWQPPAPSPAPPPPPPPPPGVTSPADMIRRMGMGINLGNTLEAPHEGAWAPPARESFFDEFKAAGFTNVRVPVRWDMHTSRVAPYTIDGPFLDRVEQVLNWSISRGMVTIVNSHHDDWLDNQTMFSQGLPRFEASQETHRAGTTPCLLAVLLPKHFQALLVKRARFPLLVLLVLLLLLPTLSPIHPHAHSTFWSTLVVLVLIEHQFCATQPAAFVRADCIGRPSGGRFRSGSAGCRRRCSSRSSTSRT